MARKPKRYTMLVELNMVPMIDIVFQLLIFLMIMPSADVDALPTNLPTGLGPRSAEVIVAPKVLRIDLYHLEPWDAQHPENQAGVSIRLNNGPVPDNKELRRRLKGAHAALANDGTDLDKIPVLISPDMPVWHRHVVAALDAAVDAGFANIQFCIPK